MPPFNNAYICQWYKHKLNGNVRINIAFNERLYKDFLRSTYQHKKYQILIKCFSNCVDKDDYFRAVVILMKVSSLAVESFFYFNNSRAVGASYMLIPACSWWWKFGQNDNKCCSDKVLQIQLTNMIIKLLQQTFPMCHLKWFCRSIFKECFFFIKSCGCIINSILSTIFHWYVKFHMHFQITHHGHWLKAWTLTSSKAL